MRIALIALSCLVPLLVSPPGRSAAADVDGGPLVAGLRDVNRDGKLEILCFGDSVTKGSGRGTYPGMLRRLLENRAQVTNQGIFGERTVEGRVRLLKLLANDHFDYVLVLEGINDRCKPDVDTAGNLRQMITDVRASGAVPLVGTLFAWSEKGTGADRSCLPATNAAIRELPATTLEFAKLIENRWSELLLDELHPNTRGYTVLANEAFRALHVASDAMAASGSAGAR